MFEPTLLLFLFTCCLAMLLPPKRKPRTTREIKSIDIIRGMK